MEEVFVVLLVASTTFIAYRATQRAASAGPGSVRAAMHALFDFVGAFAIFLVFNLTVGTIFILLLRSLTEVFIPIYGLMNSLLPLLSAAQGFVFHVWWRRD
jgi:hypothetical protein